MGSGPRAPARGLPVPTVPKTGGAMARVSVSVTVDGVRFVDEVEPRTLLVHYLRDQLGKVDTVVGCDTSNCGACTVLMAGPDGTAKAVKSCAVLAAQADGAEITTIEGLAAPDGTLHPVQRAFHEQHGLQCGFCTPGMIMAAVDIVNRKGHDLDEHTIRSELEGNLCRCTGYHNIVKAIAAGARAMGSGAGVTQKAAE